MRTTGRLWIRAVSLASVIVLALASCDMLGLDGGGGGGGNGGNGGSGTTAVTLPEDVSASFDLGQLALEYYGGNDTTGYNTDVVLVSGGFPLGDVYEGNAGGVLGPVSHLYLEVWDDSAEGALTEGSYTVDPTAATSGSVTDVDVYAQAFFDTAEASFSDSSYTATTGVGGDDTIVGGSVTVSTNEANLVFEFTFELQDGDTINGSYTGPADYEKDFS